MLHVHCIVIIIFLSIILNFYDVLNTLEDYSIQGAKHTHAYPAYLKYFLKYFVWRV